MCSAFPIAAPVVRPTSRPKRRSWRISRNRASRSQHPSRPAREACRKPDAADAGDARANGKTLALLHDVAETFQPDGALYRLDLDLLHRPLARICDSGVVEDADVRSDLEDIAARTAKAIEAFANLSWTYCHGDCHGFNARISDAGEAVFFDFDDGGPGYLAYDLSVFLWSQTSFGQRSTDMWDAFVDGYQTVRPITPDDFEAAHRFVIVRHIWLMGEYASRAQEWGSETVGWIAREANFLRRWETERCRQSGRAHEAKEAVAPAGVCFAVIALTSSHR